MNKAFLSIKIFLSMTFTTVLCAVIVSMLHIGVGYDIALEHAFMLARDGYITVGEFQYSTDTLLCSLNLVIVMPMIISAYTDDLDIAKSFIFIRLKDRKRWFSYKLFQSFIYCLYFSFIYNLSIFLTVLLMGFKTENLLASIWYMLWGSIASLLILFMIVVFGNILSLLIKPHLSAGIAVGLTIALMTIACFLPHDQIQYHLLTNYFISWHTVYSVNSDYYLLSTWIYYAIVAVIVIIELFATKVIIRKKDFI